MSRFDYVKYDEDSATKQGNLKQLYETLENHISAILADGRAKSLCLTALEESYMWTGKAIRDEQLSSQTSYL